MKKIFIIFMFFVLIGCVQIVGATIPIASFTMYEQTRSVTVYPSTHISGYTPLTVVFVDTTTGWSPYNRCLVWNFGDGTTDSSRTFQPVHTYNSPGIYFPTLTVGNAPTSTCNEKYLLTQSPQGRVEVYVLTPVVTTIPTKRTSIPLDTTSSYGWGLEISPTSIKTTVPTTKKTTVPITTIKTPTSEPTETINYSATIAEMQKKIADLDAKYEKQDNWIDMILRFFGLK